MTATLSTEPIYSAETAIAALASEDNQIRYYAAWWLGKHQIQVAWEALCQALQDERYRTPQGGYPLRRQAARALGQLKNSQAVPALIAALDCREDLQLREAVAQALGAIGDPRAVPPLVTLLEAGDEQPYEAIIEALATLKVWSIRPQIEPFLHHPSERVQSAAARYLYLLTREAKYLEKIIKLLSHENPYLRWAAAFDLGAIGHVETANAIINANVANSLKLLNLKQILLAVSQNEAENDEKKQEKSRFLMQAIDNLLIQL